MAGRLGGGGGPGGWQRGSAPVPAPADESSKSYAGLLLQCMGEAGVQRCVWDESSMPEPLRQGCVWRREERGPVADLRLAVRSMQSRHVPEPGDCPQQEAAARARPLRALRWLLLHPAGCLLSKVAQAARRCIVPMGLGSRPGLPSQPQERPCTISVRAAPTACTYPTLAHLACRLLLPPAALLPGPACLPLPAAGAPPGAPAAGGLSSLGGFTLLLRLICAAAAAATASGTPTRPPR